MEKYKAEMEMEDGEYIKPYDVPTYPTYKSLQTGAHGAPVRKG